MMLSIVLPCFNEESNIGSTVREVARWMKDANIDGEIIVVNDGSRDGSASVLLELAKEIPQLRVVTHERNQGYGVAVRSGCDAALAPWIAFMDSDGQFHASDLSLLLAQKDRAPFITGRRRRRADPPLRNLFGKMLGVLTWVTLGIWVRDVNCGMKLFSRAIWKEIRPTHGVEKLFNAEMFLRMQRKTIAWVQVDVPHYPRRSGVPTGGSVRVIARMFSELWNLKRSSID